MKVEIISLSEEELVENDFQDELKVTVDGQVQFHVYDGEPEDNFLSRNFSDVYDIGKLMRLAHEAGKQGIDIEFV